MPSQKEREEEFFTREAIILISPDGKKWKVTVNNLGILEITEKK